MGRLSRHKKVKAIDPQGRGYNAAKFEHPLPEAPKRKDMGQAMSRKMRDFMESCKKTEEVLKAKKGVKKNGGKSQAKASAENRGKTAVVATKLSSMSKDRNESIKEFEERVNRVSSEVIASNYKKKTKRGEKTVAYFKDKSDRKKQKKEEEPMVSIARKENGEVEKKTLTDFGALQDRVGFGERVERPPTLTAKPRMKNLSSVKAPLLLQQQMIAKQASAAETKKQEKSLATKGIFGELKKAKKRKELSMAQKRIMDEARISAIEQYRQIKKAKEMASVDAKQN
eukprot:Nk52_evm25s343 gene=Nk52_evmTU25s343